MKERIIEISKKYVYRYNKIKKAYMLTICINTYKTYEKVLILIKFLH